MIGENITHYRTLQKLARVGVGEVEPLCGREPEAKS